MAFSFLKVFTNISYSLHVYSKGKPLKESLVEIDSSIHSYELLGEEAKRPYGDLIPSPAPAKRFLVVKQPVGVCGIIVPVSKLTSIYPLINYERLYILC